MFYKSRHLLWSLQTPGTLLLSADSSVRCFQSSVCCPSLKKLLKRMEMLLCEAYLLLIFEIITPPHFFFSCFFSYFFFFWCWGKFFDGHHVLPVWWNCTVARRLLWYIRNFIQNLTLLYGGSYASPAYNFFSSILVIYKVNRQINFVDVLRWLRTSRFQT